MPAKYEFTIFTDSYKMKEMLTTGEYAMDNKRIDNPFEFLLKADKE